MHALTARSADVGQYLIPIACSAHALSRGQYIEVSGLAICALIQKVAIEALKTNFPRLRPNGLDCRSFPSTHSAAAFLGAGFLVAREGSTTTTIIACAAAAFVALSRCYTLHHHFSDVLVGASIGFILGALAGSASKLHI